MPKLLNVEKLENKFQNLSRSRESIQGLSTWIMHHKEVYQEIVEHWLMCISKNCNTLAMFYVANEVIQGCGKKKCPEFREAFSKVLDEATSYEHVKEIKDKIFRLLNLWKERNIYDNEFYQRIENNLNSTAKEESSEEESEEELSELEIIQQFKKQNLIDELEKLKSVESKRKEKEDILSYADVPDLSNLDEAIVRMDCQDTLKKCDAYIALVTDFTKLISKEICLRKKLLKELKNNCVFYNAQQKDVKEVASAFRIYGKRVKTVETRLAEKITTFPMPSDSPCFSEDITVSPNLGVSSYDTDDASKNTLSPISEKNQNFCSSSTSKESFSFSGKVPTEAVSKPSESIEQPSQEQNLEESVIHNFSNSSFSKITELIEETKSRNDFTFDSQGSIISEGAKKTLDERIAFTFHDQTYISDDNISNIPLKQTDLTKEIKSSQGENTKQIPGKKKTFSEKESTRLLDKEVIGSTGLEYQAEKTSLVESNSALPIKQLGTTEQPELLDSKPNKSQVQNNEDVDFLLDESFDIKSQKKLSYKRKIEFLLKSKGKKVCDNQHSQELSETVLQRKDSTQLNSPEVESTHENKKDDTNQIYVHSKTKVSELENIQSVSKVVEEKRDSKSLQTHSEITAVTKLNSPEQNMDLANSAIESVTDNVKHCDKSLNINNTLSGSGLGSNDKIQPEKEALAFNPSGTFTGTELSSFMATYMGSKEPKQPKKETLPFNLSNTFTGTDLSSLMSTDMCYKDSKQPQAETLSFNQRATFTGTALSSLMSTLSSEDSKQSKREALSSDTFTGTALSSFMSGMSNDFLKNILQKNQQNTLTKTIDESDPNKSGIPPEGKSDPPMTKSASNIPYNLINNAIPNEECSIKDCVDSTDVLQANSGDTSVTNTSSENIDTRISLHNTHLELTESPSDTASKSKYSDKPNSPLSVKEDTLSTNNSEQTVSSPNLKQSNTNEVLSKKSNLIETLQNVLVCISENMQSRCDVKTSTLEEYKPLEPPLPIESMLKIYKYLHGDDGKFANPNSNCLEIKSNTSNNNAVTVVNASTDNNYEVMDMECDSEDDEM